MDREDGWKNCPATAARCSAAVTAPLDAAGDECVAVVEPEQAEEDEDEEEEPLLRRLEKGERRNSD